MPNDVIDLPVIGRAATLRAVDEDTRSFDVVWSTGAQVRRYSWARDEEFDEELVIASDAIRTERLNNGAPFLNAHASWDLRSIIGVVEEGSIRIDGGEARARIRLSARAEVNDIWNDIRDGIIRNISVGYQVHKFERIAKADRTDGGQRALYRAVDWEPLEISAVPIPADTGAGIRADSAAGDARRNPCVLVTRTDPAAAAAHQRKEAAMPQNEAAAGADQTRNEPVQSAPTPAVAPAPTPAPVPDADAIRAEERARVGAITAICARHGVDDALRDRLITEGTGLDAARGMILDHLAAAQPAGRGVEPAPAQVRGGRQDETETRRAAMEDALFARLSRQAPSELARNADLAGRPLVEMAAIRLGETRAPYGFGERERLLRHAFLSTSDFPLLFENAMNRSLATRYADAEPTYRAIARQRTYQDFRDHQSVRVGDFPSLQPVNPNGGEIQGASFGESREATAVKAYAVRVDISRQMLVNDDLDGIAQVIEDRGAAVARFEDATFYTMMTQSSGVGPTLQETSRAVFNTTDGSKAGTNAKIDVAALGIARAAIRKQKSLDGAPLGLSPSILLVGPDKETEAQQVVAYVIPNEETKVNVFSGSLQVVVSAHISGNNWYVFASPTAAACFEWGLLAGYEAPRFRVEEVFGRQGTSMTLEHDFGCGGIDFRGGFFNAGA